MAEFVDLAIKMDKHGGFAIVERLL